MDIMQSLITDHRRFQTTLAEISRILFNSENGYFTQGRNARTTATILTMIQELVRDIQQHEGQENRMLFPRMVRERPDFGKVLRALETEHATTNRLLVDFQRALDSRETQNRDIIDLFLKLTTHMNNHMRLEEREVMIPAKRSVIGR